MIRALVLYVVCAACALAQRDPSAATPLSREAQAAFFSAEAAYRKGDYARASNILSAFWDLHPPGSPPWEQAAWPDARAGQLNGVNYGAPVCYSALRMLTEAIEWREKPPAIRRNTAVARLTVLLVGQSSGVMPTTMKQLQDRTGREVTHHLHPSMAANAQAIVDQSTWLFGEYIRAITGGRLALETNIVKLPDLNVPVELTPGDPQFAQLAQGAESQIWRAVPDEVRAATDWWWIIYPSHFPEDSPELAKTEFITGGMSAGPDGQSPAFVIDDLWLLRKPSPYAGRTPYTESERRAYLPQWFQHEFFHHLYRTYPEFKLEAASHQWFDRKTWPADFEGRLEADYYAESLHKRLQKADPPLHVKLRYAAGQ